MAQNNNSVIMTIDIGTHKSGFCLFDLNSNTPLEHGHIQTGNTSQMVKDLFAIALRRRVNQVVVELCDSHEPNIVKMRRYVEKMERESGITTIRCSAGEWRRSLHFSKQNHREDFKRLAMEYVKGNFPEQYYDTMTDDEAEAICLAAAYTKGLCSFTTQKERLDKEAQKKKNFHKHEELDDDEIAYRTYFR